MRVGLGLGLVLSLLVGCSASESSIGGTGGAATGGTNSTGAQGGTSTSGGSAGSGATGGSAVTGGAGGVSATGGSSGAATGGASTGGASGSTGTGGTTGGTGGTGGTTGGTGGTTGGTGGTTGGTGGTTGGTGGTTGGTGGTTGGTGGTTGGTGGTTGGTGGTGGCSTGSLTLPIARSGGKYVLEFGGNLLEVTASAGGRVTAWSSGGTNFLTGSNVNATNYGSTFWTAPQSAWNWPPPAGLDDAAYTGSVNCTTITMVSGTVTFGSTSYVVTKRYSPDFVRQAIDIQYSVKNVGSGTINVAPWEISRVAPNGLTFYPAGEIYSTTTIAASGYTANQNGVTWMNWATAIGAGGAGKKLFGDGTGGWMAHAGNGFVFVKSFTDVAKAQQAPGEGEVEMYLDSATAYEEVETQGAYVPVAPQASSTWSMKWYLRAVPGNVTVGVGSTSLVTFVQGLVQ